MIITRSSKLRYIYITECIVTNYVLGYTFKIGSNTYDLKGFKHYPLLDEYPTLTFSL